MSPFHCAVIRFWIAAVAFASPLFAESIETRRPPQLEVVTHGGWIGVLDVLDEEATDVFISTELRLPRLWRALRPWVGVTLTDADAWFAGAGFTYTFDVSPRTAISIGTGPVYYEKGDKWDLGFDLEFSSFIEAQRTLASGTWLGLRIGHISNAGLGRRNPGAETFSVVVGVPLGRSRGPGARLAAGATHPWQRFQD
jgi:hypothetical protein